ncbi:hypothetical protein EVAR_50654_1 [Eumeta japonica]|uniref:Uncharacterized protein n=1 Tax=Eumeta variegata TaxID=151549 RepID=A0A4C1XJZ7_EUMVA|nr:hypothetical protein EVAR_50654_1 [Eumeta japonica]
MPHVTKACKNATNIYKSIARTAKATWGLNPEIMRTIYVAVIEPIFMCASSAQAPGDAGFHWVAQDYETSQLLTGYGCFRKRLYVMKLSATSFLRMKLVNGIEWTNVGPVYYTDLVDCEANFDRLVEFART